MGMGEGVNEGGDRQEARTREISGGAPIAGPVHGRRGKWNSKDSANPFQPPSLAESDVELIKLFQKRNGPHLKTTQPTTSRRPA
ncbi:hypothetical protein CEP53_012279 [Fusarium sp. AF-6]|nr:hypothetical protein CEP53_012279 [Fusarium sp. AF-6]